MSDQPSQRPRLTVSEIAKRTGTSKRTIQRHLQAGNFPSAEKDAEGVWRIPLDEVLGAGLSLDGAQKPKPPSAESELRERAERAEAELARVRADLDSTKDRLIAVLESMPKGLAPGEVSKVDTLETKLDRLTAVVETLANRPPEPAKEPERVKEPERRGLFRRRRGS